MSDKVRFYSLPPRSLYYPFLLINMKYRDELRKRRFEHAILDSGVEIFKDKRVQEYPKSFLWRYAQWAEIVSHQNKGKVWVTIPDYPDDLNPGQFGDNVEKTLKNVEEFISREGVEWLPVIQSRYFNRFSFIEGCKKLHHLIGNYPRVAIGTVCKVRNVKYITYCCKVARKFFPKSWIHAFGLTLTALPKVTKYINSFDSLVPGAGYGGKFVGVRLLWCLSMGLIQKGTFGQVDAVKREDLAIKFWNRYLQKIADIVEEKRR